MTQTWSYLFSQKRVGTENSYLGGEYSVVVANYLSDPLQRRTVPTFFTLLVCLVMLLPTSRSRDNMSDTCKLFDLSCSQLLTLDLSVNFANTLNPNGNASNPINSLVSSTLNLTSWPSYSTPTNGGNANMLQFLYGNNTVIQDTFRSSSIAYINSVPEALNH
jgi:hypothetical protein